MAAFARERAVGIDAVVRASRVCQHVFKALVTGETLTKKDKSPVTVADFSAQAVVNTILMREFPQDPIVGEEDTKDLRGPEATTLQAKVVELANSVLPAPRTANELLAAIDYGNFAGGPKGRHWTLDPIDGTKGFLRGEQFAVCLALIEDGEVKVGIMGCPNLPVSASDPSGPRGCLFVAVKGQGAFQRSLDADSPEETPIRVSAVTSTEEASFCESVEAGHSNQDESAQVAQLLNIKVPPVRMDSQCKYGAISRGDAAIYLRLPTIKGYEENIWDHASGWLLVREAGGVVTDAKGAPLDFSIGRTLKNNSGVIATNGPVHAAVLAAVKQVLKY